MAYYPLRVKDSTGTVQTVGDPRIGASAGDIPQASVNGLVAALAAKAALASPALTGTPTAPTAAAGANSTQIATTAYADTGLALKAPLASPTFTGTVVLPSLTALNAPVLTSPIEAATVAATAATGTINFYAQSQGVLYYTANASGNWTLNVAAASGVTLNSWMAVGQTLTIAFVVTNGATPYYQTGFTIDGTAVTPKWSGGSAPTSGDASSIDAYEFTIIKTAASTYTVLAGRVRFA